MTTHGKTLACATLFVSLFASAAHAAKTWHVEMAGFDVPTCGGASPPCRSISYAVNLAAAGDTILVGPGRYGDLNHDNALEGAGEEVSNNERAVIFINKPLRVVSTHGAGATIIDCVVAQAEPKVNGVSLSGAGITFGAPDAGFTLIGRVSEDIYHTSVGVYAVATGGAIRVEGNVVLGMSTAFSANGGTGTLVFASNYAEAQSHGFLLVTSDKLGKITLTNNVVNGASFGYYFYTIYDTAIPPAQRTTITATGNVSSGNGVGYHVNVTSPLVFQNNTAAGNFAAGFETVDYSRGNDSRVWTYTLTGFSALGNLGPGIDIAPHARVNVSGSNFIGNDEQAKGNCGIRNHSGGPVQAANNFWGAATGPGPNKADAAGGSCDAAPSVTTSKPFATARFTITR